jgi:hypothetical protein
MGQQIQLTNGLIRACLERLGYAAEPGKLHLLGLRGAAPVGAATILTGTNTPDRYNDTILTFGTRLCLFSASVDPGQFYTSKPLDQDGCAHLRNGQWEYQFGTHRGHRALVQSAPVSVWRDRDGDHVQDPHEQVESGYFGINIHAGGNVASVGAHSAGCQILQGDWNNRTWQMFLALCEQSGQSRFHYFLIDARDLVVANG